MRENILHDPFLDQFITRSELAAERRVSVDTIDRMIKRGASSRTQIGAMA